MSKIITRLLNLFPINTNCSYQIPANSPHAVMVEHAYLMIGTILANVRKGITVLSVSVSMLSLFRLCLN